MTIILNNLLYLCMLYYAGTSKEPQVYTYILETLMDIKYKLL